MAGGDSSPMAVVPKNDREVDERLLKKPKLEQEQPQPAEETRGINPLDPSYSEYDPKQRKYVYTRYFFNPDLDLDLECKFSFRPIFLPVVFFCGSLIGHVSRGNSSDAISLDCFKFFSVLMH